MKNKIAGLLGLGLLGGVSAASAATAGEGITFNGFLTAGATYAGQPVLGSTRAVSQDGNIENRFGFDNDSRLGIQLSAKVNPQVSVTGQLLARGRDSYSVKADWAFLTYRANDNLSVRGGKLKLTTFLLSDYIEVGYAYPWIRPPQEVYYANPLSTMTGLDALIKFNFGDYSLLVQPYYGGSRGEEALVPQEVVTAPTPQGLGLPAGTIVTTPFTADSLTGINLSFGSDVFTIRAGYLQTLVSAPNFGVSEDKASFASAGATLDWHGVVAYSEYFEREIEGAANAAFPNQQGAYATLGYRFGKWLPHITYAWLDDHNNPTTGVHGIPLKQTSTTLGLRYELGSGAALKLEAQQVKPESTGQVGDLGRGLLLANPNTGPDHRDSVMVYGIAVDVVF